MITPEMVNITMKPGPASTWYCQPWPEKHQTQPPTASHPACKESKVGCHLIKCEVNMKYRYLRLDTHADDIGHIRQTDIVIHVAPEVPELQTVGHLLACGGDQEVS